MTRPASVAAIHRLGDVGLLIELVDLDEVLALDAAVRARRQAGGDLLGSIIDVVPSVRTLMLTLPPGSDLDGLAAMLRELDVATGPSAGPLSAGAVDIEVRYDGADLAEVARLTGLKQDEVIAAHTGTTWRAAFGGFAPGFFYLVPAGTAAKWDVPRRDEPRTRVPAGAVALAGTFSGVYPRTSPGGWQIIGQTSAAMWDETRANPALLSPGQRVRFVDAAATK